MLNGRHKASLAKVRGKQHLVSSAPQSTQQMTLTFVVDACVWWHTENGMIAKPAQSEMACVLVNGRYLKEK